MTHTSSRRLKLLSLIGASVLLIALAGVAVAGNNGGSGLAFAGSPAQYVTISEQPSVQHLGWTGYTLEAWVYPLSTVPRLSIIRNNNDYNFWIEPGGALRSQVFPSGDGSNAFTNTVATGSLIPVNQWTHIAATWITPSIQLYVNGNLVSTSSTAGTFSGVAPLRLGAGTSDPFVGQIDEVRIWNTTLSQSQIRSAMFLPLSGSEANLVGYWPFNEGSGQTTADVSGKGNTGTLGSAAGVDANDPTWVSPSLAPLGSLNATYQNGVAGMWAGRTNTASDGVVTGLDIANVTFLNAEGDDIIFGHNNAAFHGGVTDNLTTTPNAKKRWARLWELDVNDVGTTGGNVDLTFDISDAGGSGSFSSGGSYYLLRRDTGAADDFEEVTLVGSPTISGDQITFRVSVTQLGSEFTVGATSSSPSAVALTEITASSTATSVVPWLFAGAVGLVALIGWWQIRQRRVSVSHE